MICCYVNYYTKLLEYSDKLYFAAWTTLLLRVCYTCLKPMLPQISLTSRSKVNCPILRISADLKANILPTTHDFLKYYLYLKEESLKKKPRGSLSRMVDDVIQVWETSSLPTLSKPRVTELMRNRLDQCFDLKKNLSRKESVNFKKKNGKIS